MSVNQKATYTQEGEVPRIVADLAAKHHLTEETKEGKRQFRGANFLDPNGSQSHQFLLYESGVAQDFKLNCTYSFKDVCQHEGLSGPNRSSLLAIGDRASAKPKQKPPFPWEQATLYDYTDLEGNLLYQVGRAIVNGTKDFRQRAPSPLSRNQGAKKWIYTLKGVTRVLFHWPIVHLASRVIVVEGEKSALYIENLLEEAGLLATYAVTTCAQGARKWEESMSDTLRDKTVYILPDNDDPGRDHADRIGRSMLQRTERVHVVELEGLDIKEGADDWLQKGRHIGELLELLEAAPQYTIPEVGTDGKILTEFPLDDIGNGERFAQEHGDCLRYCSTRELWLTYNKGMWAVDTHGEAETRAKLTARNAKRQALEEVNLEKRVELLKHAAKLAQRGTRSTMIQDAAFERSVVVALEDFDKDPYKFNCANGTLDLRTRHFRPHSATDLLSLRSPVVYDAKADAPLWRHCLDRWIPDLLTQMYLQDSIGATLCGVAVDEFFNMLLGDGGNGKSKFLGALEALMGSYWHKTQAETLMSARDSRKSEAPSPAILALKGARLVTSHEIDERHTLSAALVKDLTGRDAVTARGMYEKRATTFVPQFTLWLVGNSKPRISDTSAGMWRRVRLIEFAEPIKDKERDPQLGEKLEAELPGILNWALDGWYRVQTYGLIVPKNVDMATALYRSEMDPIGGFLEECCEFGPSLTVSNPEIWQAWERWCAENGELARSMKFLSQQLTKRKIEPFVSGKTRKLRGIGLTRSYWEKPSQVSQVSLSEPDATDATDTTLFPENFEKQDKGKKSTKQANRDSEPYSAS